jgi:hypothetical protein
MKLNSTVALTLILLTLMLGAGCVSGLWGFALGHEALKGVTQPDTRPTSKMKGRKAPSQQATVVLLKEEDILASVKTRIDGKGKNAKPEKPKDDDQQAKETPAPQKTQSPEDDNPQLGFPVTSQNQGVTMEVRSARYSGGALLLKVNLKNEGSKTVRFLYSFLDVTDDQGRSLSASTEGLPAELPPGNEKFSGTVSIPTALLDDVNKLSLTLTDYPDQQLRLQLSGIPVKK